MALGRWQATIVDEAGNVLPGAQVTVRRETAGAPLAVLFADRDGLVPLGNPFPAGGDGFAAFHAAGGAFRIDAVSGSLTRTWRYAAGIGDVVASGSLVADALIAGAGSASVKVYTGSEAPPDNDLDNAAEHTIVAADSGVANKPLGNTGNWMVLSLKRAATVATQLAISRAGNTAGLICHRIKSSDVWQAWVRMLAESDVASIADVRSAAAATATDAQLLTAPLIESASAQVTIADAATIIVNWDAFINGVVILAGNRALGTPTNAQPGTFRTIRVAGNDGTLRSLSFAGYRGGTATLTDISNAKEYILTIFAISSTICILKATQALP